MSLPRALSLLHLEQALLCARFKAVGDDALGLHALVLARKRVLIVSVTVIGGITAGVPQGGGGQVAHGVFGSSEHVAPQEFTFGKGFIELGKQSLRGREGGDKE